MAWFRTLSLLLRVSNWSKAVFVLLGVIYADSGGYWISALFAALAFCLISSAVYIYNDIQDIEEDRHHPFKQQRPLARAEISIVFAGWVLVFLLLGGYLTALAISTKLAFIVSIYLLINLFYNHWLRQVPILDVLCIASGFMLRILAGTIGIGLPISWWLTITATLLSLVIAFGKRRLEMNLKLKKTSRIVLKRYHPRMLDTLINLTAISCFIAYISYIVFPRDQNFYFLLTIPFAGFGIWRFLSLIAREKHNDDPVSLFFMDNLSCVNLLCFFSLTILAVSSM